MTDTSTPARESIRSRARRLVSKRGTGGITVTAAAHTTFAADLDREVAHEASSGPQVQRRPGGPEGAIAIRSEASAVQRATRPARRAERRAYKATRLQLRRTRYEERVRQVLTRDRTRQRVAEASAHDSRSATTGYLTAWLPAFGVITLAVAMAVNDPGFVYATLRQVFDVSAGIGIFDVSNPDVLVALAAAVATTAALLAAAHLVGKALGTLLFSGPLQNADHPEVNRTWDSFGKSRISLIILIGMGVLICFAYFLHTIASSRFEQDVTAIFGGSDEISLSVVWFITLLPIVVTAFEVVAAAPPLAHARKSARWSLQMRIAERRHVRRDQRLLSRERAAHRRALLAILVLTDILQDVGRRALAEIVDAALATGRVDLTVLADALVGVPEKNGESADTRLPLDLSGSTANAYLPGLPVVSNTVAHAINSFTALREVPDHAPLAADWRELRENPRSYRLGAEEIGAQRGPVPSADADHHSADLHRVTPDVETTAAATESAA